MPSSGFFLTNFPNYIGVANYPSACLCELSNEELNPRLTEWLIKYNSNRPHQSLAYLSPVEQIERELAKIRSPVLPYGQPAQRLAFFVGGCYTSQPCVNLR